MSIFVKPNNTTSNRYDSLMVLYPNKACNYPNGASKPKLMRLNVDPPPLVANSI